MGIYRKIALAAGICALTSVVGVCAAPIPVAQPEVAVLDFQTIGPDSAGAARLSESVREALFRSGRAELVARNRMGEILIEQGFQQSGVCDSSACQVSVGRILGVDELVVGTWSAQASPALLTVSRLDVESAKVLGMAQWSCAEGPCNLDSAAASRLLARLWGDSTSIMVPRANDFVTPFALAIVYPVQVPWRSVTVYGLAVDALYGRHNQVVGLAVGLAGAVDDMAGIQVGALHAYATNLLGLQAGLVNSAHRVRGLQVGLVNTCVNLRGVQVGLVNRVTSRSGVGAVMPMLNAGF